MRYLFTICLSFIFIIPVFSQNQISVRSDSVKTHSHERKKNKDTASIDSIDKQLVQLKEMLKKVKKAPPKENEISFVPIPHANEKNSVVDSLPLYKEGDMKIKLLKRKSEK